MNLAQISAAMDEAFADIPVSGGLWAWFRCRLYYGPARLKYRLQTHYLRTTNRLIRLTDRFR